MGIEFRGSTYQRDVSFGKRTIKDGEAVAVWNRLGVHTQIVGPRLVYLFFSSIRFLDRVTAEPNEYIVVKKTDGSVEHMKGPVSIYHNPVSMSSCTVKKSIALNSNAECLVVQRESAETHQISTIIIRGPDAFIPQVGDKVMDFTWHGYSSSGGEDFRLFPGKNQFQVLRTNVQLLKIDLPFSNGPKASGTLALTISFQIQDILQMIQNTDDLYADFLDALSRDLSNLSSTAGLDMSDRYAFTASATSALSTVSNYPILQHVSTARGVDLSAVVFRGFSPNDQLLKQIRDMDAVEAKSATEALTSSLDRQKTANQIAAKKAKVEGDYELQQVELEGKRAAINATNEYKKLELEFNNTLQEQQLQAEIARAKTRNDEALRVLSGLKNIGVDLNLLLQHSNNAKSAVQLAAVDRYARSGVTSTSTTAGRAADRIDPGDVGASVISRIPALGELFHQSTAEEKQP